MSDIVAVGGRFFRKRKGRTIIITLKCGIDGLPLGF